MDFDNQKVYGDTSITDGLVFFVRWWKFFPKVSAPPGLVFSSEEDLRYTLSTVRMVYARMWDVAKFEEGTRWLSIGGVLLFHTSAPTNEGVRD